MGLRRRGRCKDVLAGSEGGMIGKIMAVARYVEAPELDHRGWQRCWGP